MQNIQKLTEMATSMTDKSVTISLESNAEQSIQKIAVLAIENITNGANLSEQIKIKLTQLSLVSPKVQHHLKEIPNLERQSSMLFLFAK